MKYHAKLFYGFDSISYWTNWKKETIIEKLIIPYINGQVVLHSIPGKKKAILNLKSVFELRIYKTETEEIEGTKIGSKLMKEADFEQYDCTTEILKEMKIDLASQNSLSLLQQTFPNKKIKYLL